MLHDLFGIVQLVAHSEDHLPGLLLSLIHILASSMDPGSDLLCQLFTLRSQRIPVLGLLLINAEQILCKDIPRCV